MAIRATVEGLILILGQEIAGGEHIGSIDF